MNTIEKMLAGLGAAGAIGEAYSIYKGNAPGMVVSGLAAVTGPLLAYISKQRRKEDEKTFNKLTQTDSAKREDYTGGATINLDRY